MVEEEVGIDATGAIEIISGMRAIAAIFACRILTSAVVETVVGTAHIGATGATPVYCLSIEGNSPPGNFVARFPPPLLPMCGPVSVGGVI